MDPTLPTRGDIETAARRIAGRVRSTPFINVAGEDLGLALERVTLKLELLQHTGSFKPRGAFNRILAAEVPASGLIAASGGNHGLAVAFAGNRLSMPTEIFVPETVPPIKLEKLRSLGATVQLAGDFYDAARLASERRAAQTGALVVHPYDQPDVLAGAGTVGLEIEAHNPDVETVLVAVGGGGLMGGIATWGEEAFRVVAVEPETCPTLNAALSAGRPTDVQVGGLASDSLAATRIGEIPFAVAQRSSVTSVLVPDSVIRQAQLLLWDRLRLVAEPGGATALAALLCGAYTPCPDERVTVLVCGGNTDPATVTG